MDVQLIAGEKVKGEGKNPILACNDFVRMGPGRSLPKLASQYAEMHQTTPPTLSLHTLKKWSTDYGWQERAELYDAEIEAQAQAVEKERQRQRAARRASIMQDGVALDYERVAKLKLLAAELEAQIFYQPTYDPDALRLLRIDGLIGEAEETGDPDELSEIARRILARLDPNDPKNKYPNLWAHDVKGLAGGRTVEVVRFNTALLAEYRAVLAEIAAETGGRRQRTITENIDIDLGKLTEDQLARIKAGEDALQVILSDYITGN